MLQRSKCWSSSPATMSAMEAPVGAGEPAIDEENLVFK